MTEWRPILNYEGLYEVSDDGQVRRADTGALKAQQIGHRGHLTVCLSRPNPHWTTTRWVHSLMLEAFVGARPNGLQACHNNGNSADNRIENLRWDTQASNARDTVDHGTHGQRAKTRCSKDHPYDDENTYWRRTKWGWGRACRECARLHQQSLRTKRKANV